MPEPDPLAHQLGAPPPPGLAAALTPEQAERLADCVRDARRRQARALVKAGDDALRYVPALLRKPVKKIVGLK